MGIDYAIVIGVGACFSDTFLALAPANMRDLVADETRDGHTVFVDVLYKEMNLQMHCGDVAPYPVLPTTALTRDEIIERALKTLKLTEQELTIVKTIISMDAKYVTTGTFMLHYAW
jgi:hypothetical protein